MRRKWVAGLLLGLVVIVVAFLGLTVGGYLWLKNNLPPYSNNVNASKLKAQVQVILDVNAIPHIFADSTEDAYFALGYAHARDRLWQMEIQRRVGQGRVAEILGAPALPVDRFMRTMGIYRAAEQSFAILSAQTQQALQIYAAGVNFYLENREEPLPLEFQLTQHTPEYWKPADSMVWLKMMAFILSGNYKNELLRSRLLEILTPQQLQDLFPPPIPDDPITLDEYRSFSKPRALDLDPKHDRVKSSERQHVSRYADRDLDSLWPLSNSPTSQVKASNAWVISGEYTATGAPILVNDPHLLLDAPVLWYLARIVTPELSLSGATVPGLPFHLLGHNGSIAWGLTATGSDIQDLYYETLSTSAPEQYLTPDGWRAFDVRIEKIEVRFDDELLHTVRATRHGPVISDISESAAALAGEGRAISLGFTALQAGDRTVEALYLLNRARNWGELLESVSLIKGPQQNLMYADVQGNIGFIAPAKIPIRSTGDGYIPASGDDGSGDWTAYIGFSALPQTLNPSKGWIVNANNAIVGASHPHFLTHEWEEPYRARRIESLIRHRLEGETAAYTVTDAETMLMDNISLAALELLPLMTEIDGTDAMAQQALALLRAWDGAMDRERLEPLIFMTWLRNLNQALYGDELGPLSEHFAGLHPRVVVSMLKENRAWCDDVTTKDISEGCDEVLKRSLQTALIELSAAYGADRALWRWGDAHRAIFPHPLLSRIPLLKEIFDISLETDGGNYTVNRGASYGGLIDDESRENPFDHRHGPGFRAVYDLAELENSRFMISTGQSGNPLSVHYDNFVKRWRDGEFISLRGDRKELAGSALGVLNLKP